MDQSVPSKERFSVHRDITDKIVSAIEAGAGDFIMPWHRRGPSIGRPTNAATTLKYRGVNVIALWAEGMLRSYESGLWASYQQWQKIGAQVRKGQRGTTIVFYKDLGVDVVEDEEQRRLVARASRVFNADQVDGWQPPATSPTAEIERIESAEYLLQVSGAQVRHGAGGACYRFREDLIEMPDRERFLGTPTSSPAESYYSTLLHELTHWTGAPHRLDRQLANRFGDEAYATEELVAELGAAFLCADLGISNEPRADHAAYVGHWLKVLADDPKAIFAASTQAVRSTDFLHHFTG